MDKADVGLLFDTINLVAEVSLEVARCMPDTELKTPRAEWRWHIVNLANDCIIDEKITPDTEDIDEIVENWVRERGLR